MPVNKPPVTKGTIDPNGASLLSASGIGKRIWEADLGSEGGGPNKRTETDVRRRELGGLLRVRIEVGRNPGVVVLWSLVAGYPQRSGDNGRARKGSLEEACETVGRKGVRGGALFWPRA